MVVSVLYVHCHISSTLHVYVQCWSCLLEGEEKDKMEVLYCTVDVLPKKSEGEKKEEVFIFLPFQTSKSKHQIALQEFCLGHILKK